MQRKDEPRRERSRATVNPWRQSRAPGPNEFNGTKFSQTTSNSTISEVWVEYKLLGPEIYRCQTYVSSKEGRVSSKELQKFVRSGTCPGMVEKGYDDIDRMEIILEDQRGRGKGERGARNTMLAKAFIRRKRNLSKSTVDSYIKRGRKLEQGQTAQQSPPIPENPR